MTVVVEEEELRICRIEEQLRLMENKKKRRIGSNKCALLIRKNHKIKSPFLFEPRPASFFKFFSIKLTWLGGKILPISSFKNRTQFLLFLQTNSPLESQSKSHESTLNFSFKSSQNYPTLVTNKASIKLPQFLEESLK